MKRLGPTTCGSTAENRVAGRPGDRERHKSRNRTAGPPRSFGRGGSESSLIFWRGWSRMLRKLCSLAMLSAFLLGGSAFAGTFGRVVSIGGAASDVALDEPRGVLYIADFTANRIEVMSLATKTIQTSLNVAAQPSSISISPDGHWLLIAHYGNVAAPAVLQQRSYADRPAEQLCEADVCVAGSAAGTGVWQRRSRPGGNHQEFPHLRSNLRYDAGSDLHSRPGRQDHPAAGPEFPA